MRDPNELQTLDTPGVGDWSGFDNDQSAGHKGLDDPMEGEESNANMEAIKRNPAKKKKTKAGAKGKNKVSNVSEPKL